MSLLMLVKKLVRSKKLWFGALALLPMLAATADADAGTTHLYGRYYTCDVTFLNTSTQVDLYTEYGCQGSYVGAFYLVGPGKTAKFVWGASRFEATTKWLVDNRWTPVFFAYDDVDHSLFYIGPRGG